MLFHINTNKWWHKAFHQQNKLQPFSGWYAQPLLLLVLMLLVLILLVLVLLVLILLVLMG